MAAGRFDAACAEEQLHGAEVDVGKVASCMGRPDSDAPHDLMEAQLHQQVDDGGTGRGAIAILPTIAINSDQYRGRLDAPAVLRALCAGFSEGSEPRVCLSGARPARRVQRRHRRLLAGRRRRLRLHGHLQGLHLPVPCR